MFPKYEYRNKPVDISVRNTVHECPARFHKQLEMIWVKSGQLRAIIDGKNYLLQENDIYVVFPNILHAVHRSDAQIVLIVADNDLFPLYSETLTHLTPKIPVLRAGELPELVPGIFQRIAELNGLEDSNYKQSILTGYIGGILGEVLIRISLTERNSDNNLIQKLILYLLANYTREISLEDVAKELNYSKCYISHLVAETFQCNFRALINSYRVSLAQSLLLSSQKTVSEIAYESGFKNQSSFNRIFLKQCGVTPSEFRQVHDDVQAEKPRIYIR